MANPLDYETIDRPYDELLDRTDSESTTNNSFVNGNVETQPVKSDGGSSDVWIKNFIRSENWQPKRVGFYIDGQTGHAEFSDVFISGDVQALTGIIGGFNIGATDLTATANGNTTILSSGLTAFSAGPTGFPKVTITQAGVITATGASLDGTSTIGGRTASTLATAIDSSGHFIDSAINTSAKTILGSFSFTSSGAIQIGSYLPGNSGDIKISPNGIIGRNTTGTNTFTLDATTGNATFAGSIIGSSITGSTITGGTLQTASSGLRTVINGAVDSHIKFMNGVSIFAEIYPTFFPGGTGLTIEAGNSTIEMSESNIDLSGNISINGDILSGSNTGDQDLSAYATYSYVSINYPTYSYVSGHYASLSGCTFNSTASVYVNWLQTTGSAPQLGSSSSRFLLKGSAVYYTSLINDSDRSLKKNIESIPTGLNKILSLNPISFEYDTDLLSFDPIGGKRMGFVAQEVEEIIPEIVSEDKGLKGVSTISLIPLLVIAIKELNEEIEKLKKKT